VEGINSIVTGNLPEQELVDCSTDGNLTSDEEEETWGRGAGDTGGHTHTPPPTAPFSSSTPRVSDPTDLVATKPKQRSYSRVQTQPPRQPATNLTCTRECEEDEDHVVQCVRPRGGCQAQHQGRLLAHHRRQGALPFPSPASLPIMDRIPTSCSVLFSRSTGFPLLSFFLSSTHYASVLAATKNYYNSIPLLQYYYY
jgi:hypothetical protein